MDEPPIPFCWPFTFGWGLWCMCVLVPATLRGNQKFKSQHGIRRDDGHLRRGRALSGLEYMLRA